METTLSLDRWRQIAIANFDRYVIKRMIEVNFIVTQEGIDDQDLCNMAAQMKCDPALLKITIINSCSRIAKENSFIPITVEKENMIIKTAAKLHLKEVSTSLLNFKREFGKIVQELNHKNIDLSVTVDELKAFVGPLHLEVITEFYSL